MSKRFTEEFKIEAVKRLYRRAGVIELRPENPAYPPIRFGDEETLEVWGVVVGTICRFDA